MHYKNITTKEYFYSPMYFLFGILDYSNLISVVVEGRYKEAVGNICKRLRNILIRVFIVDMLFKLKFSK